MAGDAVGAQSSKVVPSVEVPSVTSTGQRGGVTAGYVKQLNYNVFQNVTSSSLARFSLAAAHDVVAETECSKRSGPNSFRVIMGADEGIVDHFPVYILTMADPKRPFGGQPIIQVDRIGDRISVKKLLLFDRDYRKILDIDSDSAWINPGYEAKSDQNHELIVKDDTSDDVIFDIRYANRKTLIIKGIFRFKSDSYTVNITGDGTHIVYPNGEDSGPMSGCIDHFSFAMFSY